MESYRYCSLSEPQKKLYMAVYDGLKNQVPAISINGNPSEIFGMVVRDHPELFYVGTECRMAASLLGARLMPRYLYDKIKAEQLNRKLEAAAQEILSRYINDHQSDYDKALVLHDYLKSNVQYNFDAAQSRSSKGFENSYNIIGALLDHCCVCAGFAAAFKYLCDRVGVDCHVVTGTGSSSLFSGPHAWNIVRINGYYHHIDVTWDNQSSSDSGIPNYGYFNLDDETISKDHTWDRKLFPPCPEAPYNYFRVNNAVIDSQVQLEKFLYENMLNDEQRITFKVRKGSDLETEIAGCLNAVIRKASARLKYNTVTKYKMEWIPEQLVYTIMAEYSC